MEDKCVICGEIIPEGRQVCPKCEHPVSANNQTEKLIQGNLNFHLFLKRLYTRLKRSVTSVLRNTKFRTIGKRLKLKDTTKHY